MKVRDYLVESLQKSIFFCPHCHHEVKMPFKGEIKLQSALSLVCGFCKGGTVRIKLKQPIEEKKVDG